MKLSKYGVLTLALSMIVNPMYANAAEKTAVFAGGCFWCMEKPYD